MAENSKIEWTDATWTPVRARYIGLSRDNPKLKPIIGWHCEHASEGCRNCYAETMNKRLGTGLDYKPGNLAPRGTAEMFLDENLLLAPLKWRKPKRIFACSMTDLFADFVPDAFIDRMFAVMALCPQHSFQVLTKRPERMRDYLNRACGRIADAVMALRKTPLALAKGLGPNAIGPLPHIEPGAQWWPLPNVWLGTSVEDQAAADARIPHLLATPAAKRFLSCEPLLGPVDLTNMDVERHIAARELGLIGGYWINALSGKNDDMGRPCPEVPSLDWVIAGGESGPGARPMHPDWARSLRDQCAAAGVPFFFKQWGNWSSARGLPGSRRIDHVFPDGFQMVNVGKTRAGRLLDGVTHDGFPA